MTRFISDMVIGRDNLANLISLSILIMHFAFLET